jgi:hypothetical protein
LIALAPDVILAHGTVLAHQLRSLNFSDIPHQPLKEFDEQRQFIWRYAMAAGSPDLQLEKAAELVLDLIVTFFTPADGAGGRVERWERAMNRTT